MTPPPLPDDVIDAIREQVGDSPMAAHVDAMLPHVRPAINLRVDDEPDDDPRVGGTRIRGPVDAPPGWRWPTRNGVPLALLAQFDCAELEPVDYFNQLPHAGVLSFFYDLAHRAWGDEPDARDAARVEYFPDASAVRRVDGDPPQSSAYGAKLFLTWELPSQARWFKRRFGHLGHEQQFADYARYLSDIVPPAVIPLSGHQLLGHATREQDDDLELQCETRRRGIKQLKSANPAYREVDQAAEDWILLAQFAWDDETLTGEDFGDGHLYYFIRRNDLALRDFRSIQIFFEVS